MIRTERKRSSIYIKKRLAFAVIFSLSLALLSGCSGNIGAIADSFKKNDELYCKAEVSEDRLNELAARVRDEREQKEREQKEREQKEREQKEREQKELEQNARELKEKLTAQTGGAMPAAVELSLPADSTLFDPKFASTMLYVTSANNQESAKRIFESLGMKVELQAHYDKPKESAEHTSAYTVGTAKAEKDGVERNVILINIRGTSAGEWYSNFDFAPSHSEETEYAENFMMAAQDIATGIAPILMKTPSPIIIITGHSRGAACANLLGGILDAQLPISDIYVYTSATPTTVRGNAALQDCPNIFNLINPCDVVPMMPLPQWGYKRLGTDIILPADEAEALRVAGSMESLYEIAPTITSYYGDLHSLTHTGPADDTEEGMTTHEAMKSIADSFMAMYSEQNIEMLMKAYYANPETFNSASMLYSTINMERFENSDFKLLFELYNSAQQRGTIFSEHLQNRYIGLLAEYGK